MRSHLLFLFLVLVLTLSLTVDAWRPPVVGYTNSPVFGVMGPHQYYFRHHHRYYAIDSGSFCHFPEYQRQVLCGGKQQHLQKQRGTPKVWLASNPPKDPTGVDGVGSYMEGVAYDCLAEEIVAMGGDPFFLGDYEDNVDDKESFRACAHPETFSSTGEWSGFVDDNAHLDWD